jgi:DNA-binding MarR family transcriptional regulator
MLTIGTRKQNRRARTSVASKAMRHPTFVEEVFRTPRRLDDESRASAIPPDDAELREFVADLYAAMSMMRLLRHEIASALSLSSAEYSVLLAVWHLERKKDMTLRAIADHLHVAAAYVTSEVARLVDKGLLTKTPDAVDRRAVGVGLTKTARDLLRRLVPMLRDINSPLFTGLYYRDLVTVHRFLRSIIEHGHDAIRIAQGFRPDRGLQGRAGRSGRSRR